MRGYPPEVGLRCATIQNQKPADSCTMPSSSFKRARPTRTLPRVRLCGDATGEAESLPHSDSHMNGNCREYCAAAQENRPLPGSHYHTARLPNYQTRSNLSANAYADAVSLSAKRLVSSSREKKDQLGMTPPESHLSLFPYFSPMRSLSPEND